MYLYIYIYADKIDRFFIYLKLFDLFNFTHLFPNNSGIVNDKEVTEIMTTVRLLSTCCMITIRYIAN